jgi:hypothetical protein
MISVSCFSSRARLRERHRSQGNRVALEEVIGNPHGGRPAVFAGGYLFLEVGEQIAPVARYRNL